MNDLSPHARRMLEQFRSAESMAPVAKDQAVQTALARGARGDLPRFDVTTQPPTAPKVGWLHTWSVPAKTFAVLGVAAVPTVMAARALNHHAPVAVAPPTIAAEPSPATASPSPEAPATAEPVATDPAPIASPLEPVKRSARLVGSAPRPPAPTEAPTIDGEVLLLNQAQLATRAGNPARALQILDEYGSQYPNGRLADARAVSRLVALCDLGRVADVRREADQFKARYPSSPLYDRVNKICAGKTP
jgi:hypothetical protein